MAAPPSIHCPSSPWIVAKLAQNKLYPIPIRRTASDFGEVDPPNVHSGGMNDTKTADVSMLLPTQVAVAEEHAIR